MNNSVDEAKSRQHIPSWRIRMVNRRLAAAQVHTDIMRPRALTVDESFFSVDPVDLSSGVTPNLRGLRNRASILRRQRRPGNRTRSLESFPRFRRDRGGSVGELESPVSSPPVEVPSTTVKKGSASVPSSIFTLANTTIGAGTLALPYFYSETGIILGSIMLFIVASLSALSLHLLVRCGELSKRRSYMDVAFAAFGKPGQWAVETTMMLLCFGAITAYLVIIGTLLRSSLESLAVINQTTKGLQMWYLQSNFLCGFSVLSIMLPLSLLKNLSALAFTSLLSLLAILFVVGLVAWEAISHWSTTEGEFLSSFGGNGGYSWARIGPKFFLVIPTVGLAFTNQPNIYQIVCELERPTSRRVYSVINITTCACTCLYFLIGIIGYLRFGHGECSKPPIPRSEGGVCDDILLNYDSTNSYLKMSLFSSARLAMVISLIFSVPLLVFPARVCLHSLLRASLPPSLRGGAPNLYFIAETILLLASAFIVNVLVPDIISLFGLTGAVTGSLLVYILPASFYLSIKRKEEEKSNSGPFFAESREISDRGGETPTTPDSTDRRGFVSNTNSATLSSFDSLVEESPFILRSESMDSESEFTNDDNLNGGYIPLSDSSSAIRNSDNEIWTKRGAKLLRVVGILIMTISTTSVIYDGMKSS
eukprot:g1900.t1